MSGSDTLVFIRCTKSNWTMRNPPMEAILHTIAVKRWRILLPVLMTALSVYLMLLAKEQQHLLWKMGTGWEVPARVLNSVVNGPGFFFGGLIPAPIPHALNERLNYDGDRLLAIALFWFLIGLSIDRRINKQALDSHHPLFAAILFTCAALVCCVFGFGFMTHLFCPGGSDFSSCWDQGRNTIWLVLKIIVRHPLRTWAAMDLMASVWLLTFCIYFGARAFVAAKRRLIAVV